MCPKADLMYSGEVKLKNWETYAEDVRSLAGRLGFGHSPLRFLAFTVELESGKVYDEVRDMHIGNPTTLYILLTHYSKAEPTEKTDRLVRYRDLPGGYAYEEAFKQRAISPIARIFGENPEMLLNVAEALNGIKLPYGDASVEIPALPEIPLAYIVWRGCDEFQPSANILYDASASNYLPTEDLAALGELTTLRLEHIYHHKKSKQKQNFK